MSSPSWAVTSGTESICPTLVLQSPGVVRSNGSPIYTTTKGRLPSPLRSGTGVRVVTSPPNVFGKVMSDEVNSHLVARSPRVCTATLLETADAFRRAGQYREAWRFYKLAHEIRELPPRYLYRFGESLIQDGHAAQGRECLSRLVHDGEASYQAYSTSMITLSYVLEQRDAEAIDSHQMAERLHCNLSSCNVESLLALKAMLALTLIRMGRLEACAAVASKVADHGYVDCPWLEMILFVAGLAEAFMNNFSAAQQLFGHARKVAKGSSADRLACEAMLAHLQADYSAAESLLEEALQTDKKSPFALMRMGYFLLCRGNVDRSIQLLQQSIRPQPVTLTFGAAERSAARLYLGIALHCRDPETAANAASGHIDAALQYLPGVLAECQEFGLPSWHAVRTPILVSAPPSGLGSILLTPEQIHIVLRYTTDFVEHGQCPGVRTIAPGGSRKQRAETCFHLEGDAQTPTDTGTKTPTLIGTDSTVEPPSWSPMSRAPSLAACGADTADPEADGDQEDADRISRQNEIIDGIGGVPPEKIIAFRDLRLGRCIGRGQSSKVCLGRSGISGNGVVVKMVHQDDGLPDEQSKKELLAEIQMTARLEHPRLAQFVGVVIDVPHLALVTELAPGGSLHNALHVTERRFTRKDRFQFSVDLMEAVSYLHSQQPPVAHLDLKSMNLVLDEALQHVQVCDFGLARVVIEGEVEPILGLKEKAQNCCGGGSPRYMAPECHGFGSAKVTQLADVWSSGCVLVEIFGGCVPYSECTNVQQVINEMLVGRREPSIPSTVEPTITNIASSMLAFDAAERKQASQCLQQLRTAE